MILAPFGLVAALAMQAAEFPARDPAFAPDGRLAVSVNGDLWVRGSGAGAWTRVSEGAAWDHSPAWLLDGSGLVFVSDRNGAWDLFRLEILAAVPAVSAVSAPSAVAITSTATEWESEPAVAPEGVIIFVRGRGPTARLWIRSAQGVERRVTHEETDAERWPAVSPDGKRVAYVRVREGPDELRIRWLAGDSSVTVLGDRELEAPTWSPTGDRLLFTTRSGRTGVWVTPADGRYVNLVSARRARAAWAPDGRSVVLAMVPPADVGYNGDPEPGSDRERAPALPDVSGLWRAPAPVPLDDGVTAVEGVSTDDRRSHNLQAFDAVWRRVADRYVSGARGAARRAEWQGARDRHRAQAGAAGSERELEAAIYEMLRERPPLRDQANGWAAVSSAHPVATEAGLEMLRRGGNVVDAAVAVSFTLGVVEPDASGVGGYGQMLVGLAGTAVPALIEFMSRAPEEATLANAGLLQSGGYPRDGPVLATVPGTVAAMELAWRTYGSGRIAWADLVAPAIRAAEDGYVVSAGLATTLARERVHFLKYPASRRLFFRNGEPVAAGDTLRNPDLAWTLRQIAEGGAKAFYQGEVARRLVSDLRGQGNAMRPSDLARYFAAERSAVAGTYRGYDVYSSAPPAGGGATLVAQLNLLEHVRSPRPYTEDAATAHAMIEAWKLVPTGRGRIADPGLWPVRLDAFISKDSASLRWRCFRPDRPLTAAELRGGDDSLTCAGTIQRTGGGAGAGTEESSVDCGSDHACHQSGTTAFVVADAAGNVVSTTQTLGTWGGNFYVTPGLGFLYNDKLTSYGLDPDQYGARLPYARHGSSLAPTLVYRGGGADRRPVLAVGAAGNAWITAAVYSIVTGVLDHGLSPQAAIERPRFLVGGRGSPGSGAEGGSFVVQIEDGLAPEVTRRLGELGHELQPISLRGELRMGYASAITIGDGTVSAGADPRRSGAAGAVQCGEVAGGCRK